MFSFLGQVKPDKVRSSGKLYFSLYSFLLPRLLKLPGRLENNWLGNLGSVGNNKEIQPQRQAFFVLFLTSEYPDEQVAFSGNFSIHKLQEHPVILAPENDVTTYYIAFNTSFCS